MSSNNDYWAQSGGYSSAAPATSIEGLYHRELHEMNKRAQAFIDQAKPVRRSSRHAPTSAPPVPLPSYDPTTEKLVRTFFGKCKVVKLTPAEIERAAKKRVELHGPEIDPVRQTKRKLFLRGWVVRDKTVAQLRREGRIDYRRRQKTIVKHGPSHDPMREVAEKELFGSWYVRPLTMQELVRKGTIAKAEATSRDHRHFDPVRQVREATKNGQSCVRNRTRAELRRTAREKAREQREEEKHNGPPYNRRTHKLEKDLLGSWYTRPLSMRELSETTNLTLS